MAELNSGKLKIAVAIKQVPQSGAAIDPKGFLLRSGPCRLNPHDGPALEMALRLKDALGATVEAFTMGPKQAQDMLKEALGLGLDRAWHLCDPAFAGADSLATARTLAAALTLKGPFDLVVCGRVTVDGGTAQVGPALAKLMGYPFIGRISEIVRSDFHQLVLTELYRDEKVTVSFNFPAVVSALRDGFTPRLPTLRDRLRPKIVETLTLQDLPNCDAAFYGDKGSPTKIKRSYRPSVLKSNIVPHSPSQAAAAIVEALKSLD
jgi:electron transfer flavoprotein beta subunit